MTTCILPVMLVQTKYTSEYFHARTQTGAGFCVLLLLLFLHPVPSITCLPPIFILTDNSSCSNVRLVLVLHKYEPLQHLKQSLFFFLPQSQGLFSLRKPKTCLNAFVLIQPGGCLCVECIAVFVTRGNYSPFNSHSCPDIYVHL